MKVLTEFQAAIEIEHQKSTEEHREQMNLPIDERVAKGISMSNLTVEFEFYDGQPNDFCPLLRDSRKYISSAKITCDNNISKFKEGNTVVLSHGGYFFEMDVEEDSTDNFILKPNDFNVKFCSIDAFNYPKNNWEINIEKSDIGKRLLETAAEILRRENTTLNKIEDFLNGKTINTFNQYNQAVPRLNPSQNKAYLNAINADKFSIIQGPPGTGKTETIGHLVNYFVEQGLKVFITANTHTAINNCVNAASNLIRDPKKLVKIGEKAQFKEIKDNLYITKKSRLSFYSYKNASGLNQEGIAIGATAYSLCYPSTKRLLDWEFDIAIIDEASQMSIPLSIAAMCRTKKYIFVGDHKQLDPIIPKNTNNEMFAESIFSRLARIYPNEINLLEISYRLNPKLIAIPNQLSYNNLLSSDKTTKIDEKEYHCKHYPEVLNNESHILINHDVFDSQGRSPYEAILVAKIIEDLLSNQVDINEIGVMSPYRAQVREIKKQVKKIIPKHYNNALETLFVDTVDSMQGQERNYIIYSMANSNPLESKHRLDFFYSPNRLNVAITRAIKKCIVIANYKIFDIKDDELIEQPEYQEVKNSLEIFKKYFTLTKKIEINEIVDENW